MVLAYHITFGAYGFWLPNDPRGSWSDYVGSRELYRYGSATKTRSLESRAREEHDHERRLAAKSALLHPVVEFTGVQARAIAHGIRAARQEAGYEIYACAVMPNHVHLVIARHARHVNQMIGHLKSKATMALHDESLWPRDNRRIWERGGWAVFLSEQSMLFNAIRYVEANPVRDGLSTQRWSFVTTYFGPSAD